MFFGPYKNAGSNLIVGTINKVVNYKNLNISMISIDLDLNYKDKFIQEVGLNQNYSYTFISSTNGLPLFYSNIDLVAYPNATFTKIEF